MAFFTFTCRNPGCRCAKRVALEDIPDTFWQGGYRNPGFFDRTLCKRCGVDRPEVLVMEGDGHAAVLQFA
ncbi:hypothetical protein [Falsirhodobacter xinxiangensis]|uniref:hypothetical protein n=1 Tax=Falsirhodobacter xinxiangensis TaxID=2530049 RepID=UPI0010A9E339|nr:hypothetical protein [Rhodobacter xinxiangensis]